MNEKVAKRDKTPMKEKFPEDKIVQNKIAHVYVYHICISTYYLGVLH